MDPSNQHDAGAEPFASLADEQFLALTTFRASGAPVPTTVWFAREGSRLYITTLAHSGKVKRIRANRQVLVTPSDRRGQVHGTALAAQARVIDDTTSEEGHAAANALERKYGEQMTQLLASAEHAPNDAQRVYLMLEP